MHNRRRSFLQWSSMLIFKEKKAKVVKLPPFPIQLLYGSSGWSQPVSLGVYAGTKHIGCRPQPIKVIPY
ncbi:RRXRR domain-containing protein [Bacillus sp. T33-2]|uniref:RRXRR domain-containing protein n=1 Tax=Bacillus sp. T33-2 TaxID=2054168 RepID=UPI000C780655|nr:RRXRR domain-containing protein [Bacillus sp. T33-2]PLR95288.1 hypothetical protein CVD19_15075 [Bacillus sp. T33-2]